MKALDFIFNDTEIHFLLGNDKNVMVNATEMAKAFGKRTDVFLKSDHAKGFISAAILPPNGGRLGIFSENDLISNQGRNGIYFHRVLALKFAAWLDTEFEFWVYSTIEEILFGNAKIVGVKISEAEQKKLDIAILKEKVKAKGDEDTLKLLSEIDELKRIEKEKKKAMNSFTSQYKLF